MCYFVKLLFDDTYIHTHANIRFYSALLMYVHACMLAFRHDPLSPILFIQEANFQSVYASQ